MCELDAHLQVAALHIKLGDIVRLQKLHQFAKLVQLFPIHRVLLLDRTSKTTSDLQKIFRTTCR